MHIGVHLLDICTHTTRALCTSAALQTMPYRLNESTGIIDYDTLEKNAVLFRPKIIVAGGFGWGDAGVRWMWACGR